MARSLENKVALVTGASSGIGRAAALLFAREGAKVILANRRSEDGDETARMVRKAGGEALFVKTDVAERADIEALIRKAVDTYGRLDCAFNNAGIEGESANTIECTEENFDEIIRINLKGVWLCMKYEIQQMLKQGGGVIVNNASIVGMIALPTYPAYCASKGGVIQLTRTAAVEYARSGIRVNAVCPGGVSTAMTDRIFAAWGIPEPQKQAEMIDRLVPMNRMGVPEEIAQAVAWMCSDAASYVTGHTMVVDGGFVAQ